MNISLLLANHVLYYVSTHIKLSSTSGAIQLIDIFAYENPVSGFLNRPANPVANPVIVYHFQNIFSHERLFIFTINSSIFSNSAPKSLENLYATSAWLEREVSELGGITFESKRDLRNLMLQYGDASSPFRKSYPSIGTKEIFYDSVADNLFQSQVSIQI